MSIKIRILLLFIVGLAFSLRLYNVWDNPPALSWDEVSIGYNAYSILKTGRDEHGRFLPVDTFIAYGDYKPPLAIYITVPFVAIFGLNELAVRLPSVLFGTLTVLLTYFLVKELFRDKNNSAFGIPATTSLLLAISPWHINLSRAGFEATIALFFIVLGVVLCLAAQRKEKLYWVCWLPFIAAVYTFNSARFFVPLLALGVIIFIGKRIVLHKKNLLGGIILSIVLLLPIFPHLFSKQAMLRFREVNIFSDISAVVTANNRIAREGNFLLSRVLNNRRVGYAYSMLGHYMDHFDPKFLFISGDGNPKFSTQDVGELYLIEAPLLAIGMIMLFLHAPKIALFLLFWLLVSIIPAATARETPHALRILNSLPTWQIFIAYGLWVCMRKNRRILVVIVAVIYIFQVTYYIYNYHTHYRRAYAPEWQYGYKQAIRYAKGVYDAYDHIFVTDRIGRPYMYTLFYTQYDPGLYLGEKNSYFDAAGFYHVDGFDKYVFIKTLPDPIPPKSLIIGDSSWVGPGDQVLKEIMYPDGTVALVIYEHT